MPVIELDRLHVYLARQQVLKGVSLSVSGRAIGLLGPNGAGKSTLMRTLLGFHAPRSGSARVLGHDCRLEARLVRSKIGYMPENDSFIEGMSAVRFVRYMAELHGLPRGAAMERAHEALFWVGLGESRYRDVETFSTGMKQRVKLAQAIVHGPRLLLLDEPTNGLDPPGRQRMLELIADLTRCDDLHVLISSHLLKDVETCADQAIIMKDGQLAALHDLRKERDAQRRFLDVELAGERGAFLEGLDRKGWEHATTLRDELRIVMPSDRPMSELFALATESAVIIHSLSQKQDTLEDVFRRAMESDLPEQSPRETSHVGH